MCLVFEPPAWISVSAVVHYKPKKRSAESASHRISAGEWIHRKINSPKLWIRPKLNQSKVRSWTDDIAAAFKKAIGGGEIQWFFDEFISRRKSMLKYILAAVIQIYRLMPCFWQNCGSAADPWNLVSFKCSGYLRVNRLTRLRWVESWEPLFEWKELFWRANWGSSPLCPQRTLLKKKKWKQRSVL